jgi:hypothetical protein
MLTGLENFSVIDSFVFMYNFFVENFICYSGLNDVYETFL